MMKKLKARDQAWQSAERIRRCGGTSAMRDEKLREVEIARGRLAQA